MSPLDLPAMSFPFSSLVSSLLGSTFKKGGNKRLRGGYRKPSSLTSYVVSPYKGISTGHVKPISAIVEFRYILQPTSAGGYLVPTAQFFSFSPFNLGHVPTASTGSPTAPNWSYAEDNWNRLQPYFANYREYRIAKIAVSMQDTFPALRYNQVRLSDSMASAPQQYGEWYIRSDPTTEVYNNLDSYRDLVGDPAVKRFEPGQSQNLNFTIKPRYRTITPGLQYITNSATTTNPRNYSLNFSYTGSESKYRPTFSTPFSQSSSDAGEYPSPVQRAYDNCGWNGLLAVYRPPIDYLGNEYLQTGYDPSIINSVVNSIQVTFRLEFLFRGRMIYPSSSYPSNRSYNNYANQNSLQYSFIPAQNQPNNP